MKKSIIILAALVLAFVIFANCGEDEKKEVTITAAQKESAKIRIPVVLFCCFLKEQGMIRSAELKDSGFEIWGDFMLFIISSKGGIL